jgi:hypothetical protein
MLKIAASTIRGDKKFAGPEGSTLMIGTSTLYGAAGGDSQQQMLDRAETVTRL